MDNEEGRLSPPLPSSLDNIKESNKNYGAGKGGYKREEGAFDEVANLEWRSL